MTIATTITAREDDRPETTTTSEPAPATTTRQRKPAPAKGFAT